MTLPASQQDDVDHQQERPDAEILVDDPGRHLLRDLLVRHQEREQHRVGDDVEQHRTHARGLQQHLRHFAELQFLVDEHGDEEGVDRGDRGGFRRREDAAIDAAEHDRDQQQAPDALAERVHLLAEASPSACADSRCARR